MTEVKTFDIKEFVRKQKEQKLKEQELKVQEVRPDQEKELSTDTIWDKGSFVQGELFSTEDEKKLLSKEARKQHKIIGQIFDTYNDCNKHQSYRHQKDTGR